ncbi:MAG: phosphoribosyltransferase [Sulfolobales archaeon]
MVEVFTKFNYVSWETLHSLVARLALSISRSYLPQVLVGALRGGYVVARMLSDFLGIDELAVIGVKFYKGVGERGEKPVITVPVVHDVKDKAVLVVDDVADTGRTLETAVADLRLRGARSVKTAVVFLKPRSIVIPDFYAEITDSWVIFPWEICDFLREMTRKGDLNAVNYLMSYIQKSSEIANAIQQILGVSKGEDSTRV